MNMGDEEGRKNKQYKTETNAAMNSRKNQFNKESSDEDDFYNLDLGRKKKYEVNNKQNEFPGIGEQ